MGVELGLRNRNERNSTIKLERCCRVAELYLRGMTQQKIATELSIPIRIVDDDLAFARKLWKERAADAIGEHKAEQLQRIDMVEAEAWRGWRRSLRHAIVQQDEKGSNPDGSYRKHSVRKANQAGDAKFLQVVQHCIDQRIKLLNLDSPENVGGMQAALVEIIVNSREEAEKALPYVEFVKIAKPPAEANEVA